MTQSVSQIEKHTIVTRLSLSFYKMETDELVKILNLLEDDFITDEYEEELEDSDAPLPPDVTDAAIHRQMVIARLFVLINQLDRDALLQRLRPFQHPDFRWIREYPRLACYLVVDFASGGKAFSSTIRDISAGGVFIETKESFKEGQELSLCFTLSEAHEKLPFKISGRVMRTYPDGIGVQYQDVTEYQRDILSALIDKIE